MATINVSAGHNPSGKIASGAVGFLNESNQARKVTKKVIELLSANGHIIHDCTCNNGISQSDVLKKIVDRCNLHHADLNISIHFNAGRKDTKGDGKTGGCEVLVSENIGIKGKMAASICKEIAKLGYTNRGVKTTNGLYYLKHTKAPAILIECAFVDDADDYNLYKKGNYAAMAKAIAAGIEKGLK